MPPNPPRPEAPEPHHAGRSNGPLSTKAPRGPGAAKEQGVDYHDALVWPPPRGSRVPARRHTDGDGAPAAAGLTPGKSERRPQETEPEPEPEPQRARAARNNEGYAGGHAGEETFAPNDEGRRARVAQWRPHTQPVALDLVLPDDIAHQDAFKSKASTKNRYGFDLKLSNGKPLDDHFPDYRMKPCHARVYPPPSEMPKVSVIIIYYNEPLSTLLRNVVNVLNLSPAELLGEIVLVDDHSTLDELKLLPEHLARLRAKLPKGKIHSVRRDIHNGIVGARVRGAEEAAFPIILFLDSHSQVCDGWLEPLVARIHEDPTRVVVPNIRGINIDTLKLIPGDSWPPARGFFNWRLSFTIETADTVHDLAEPGVDLKTAAMRSPVMPGGLFAMDREFFFKIGAYDPLILYYGAEHVELSFRVWMCGGSMESIPCSNVGHIYREFNRFGAKQDPLLKNVDISSILNRNDARVAEVWLDDYKDIFYHFRGLRSSDKGDLSGRIALRERLQCKSFAWFLKTVCRDQYVPDRHPAERSYKNSMAGADDLCIDGAFKRKGAVQLKPCRTSHTQLVSFTQGGYLQLAKFVQHVLTCIRIEMVSQMECDVAPVWQVSPRDQAGEMKLAGKCLTRGTDSGDQVRLRACDGRAGQQWLFKSVKGTPDAGTLSGPEWALCLDNMQKLSGPPGLYGCHGYGTQRWKITPEGKIRVAQKHSGKEICIGSSPTVGVYRCLADDPDFT